jgi:hypothetical protein
MQLISRPRNTVPVIPSKFEGILNKTPIGDLLFDFQHFTRDFFQANITSPLISLLRDPLIIDLDGDGITLTALGVAGEEGASGVFFDYDGDGFGERTGWVSPNDGILVYDRNRNGTVDGASDITGTALRTLRGQHYGHYGITGTGYQLQDFLQTDLLRSHSLASSFG